MATSPDHRSSRWLSWPFVGSVVGLAVLAGITYRHALCWDPSAPGLPDVQWFFFGSDDTAPQIVYAIALFLLVGRRKRLARTLGGEGSPLAALPLLGAGFALFLWAHHAGAPDLILLSFLPFCLGSALLLFGGPFTREIALPVLFLAFALPVPGVLTNQIVFPLQLWNAELTARLLTVAGIPVVQEGDMLYFADRSFEIIETCSGLRAIVVLSMVAVGLVCLLPASGLHLALLVASAWVIAWCLNAVRVLAVVMGPNSDPSAPHALQGAAVLLVGGAALSGVDAVLRRCLGNRTAPATAAPPEVAERSRIGRTEHAMALALVLGLMLGGSIWMPRWTPPNAPELPGLDLPERIGGWVAVETLEPDWLFLGHVGSSKFRYRRYQRDGESVAVFVALDHRLSRSRSLISPKIAFPGRGWEEEERGTVELGPGGLRAVSVVARSQSTRMLSFHWYGGIGGLGEEMLRAWLATDRSLLRRPGGARGVRLSTEISPIGEGRSRADARLRELGELLLESFGDGVQAWRGQIGLICTHPGIRAFRASSLQMPQHRTGREW